MLVGFGLINKDFVAVVPRWERDEKTRAIRYFEQVGGPVPVALTTAARLGGIDCLHLGVVGDDREAGDLRTALAEQRVEAHLQSAPGIATSRSLVLLDTRDGSRTLANYAEELPPFVFAPEHTAILQRTQLLHVDGRDLEGALHAATVVRAAGGQVSLDLGTMRPGREQLFPLCNVLLASKGGGAGAFPALADDPPAQVRAFLRAGVGIAGVTLAERGLVLGTQAQPEPVFLPAFAVSAVVDTCGAGDTFHGAFCWAHLHGHGAHAAAEIAQAAVALRLQHYGNQRGMPTRAALEHFLAMAPKRREERAAHAL